MPKNTSISLPVHRTIWTSSLIKTPELPNAESPGWTFLMVNFRFYGQYFLTLQKVVGAHLRNATATAKSCAPKNM